MSGISSLRKLSKITKGELHLISRRRAKKSQSEMAKKLKVSYHFYRGVENDTELAILADVKKILPLTMGEVCLLYRRRAKKKLEDVAREMVRCPYWIRQMEQGKIDCTELLRYWEVSR